MPYEPNLVARLVSWWRETGANTRFSSSSVRTPTTNRRDERFRAAIEDPGAAFQSAELDLSRGPGDASPARRLRDRERRDDHARGARERPADGVRHASTRERRRAAPGRSSTCWRPLPRAHAIGRVPASRELRRARRGARRGRSRTRRAQRRAQEGGARRRRRGRRPGSRAGSCKRSVHRSGSVARRPSRERGDLSSSAPPGAARRWSRES